MYVRSYVPGEENARKVDGDADDDGKGSGDEGGAPMEKVDVVRVRDGRSDEKEVFELELELELGVPDHSVVAGDS